MSSPEARQELQRAQAGLAAALVGNQQVPTGFDPERVRLSSRKLAVKRRREAFHAAPVLESWLGEDAEWRFADYRLENPYPASGGPEADALQFHDWLSRTMPVPPSVRRERQSLRRLPPSLARRVIRQAMRLFRLG